MVDVDMSELAGGCCIDGVCTVDEAIRKVLVTMQICRH